MRTASKEVQSAINSFADVYIHECSGVDKAVAYADIRILEYRGLDQTSPLDVTFNAAGQ